MEGISCFSQVQGSAPSLPLAGPSSIQQACAEASNPFLAQQPFVQHMQPFIPLFIFIWLKSE
jgi:hypothetical protein